MVSEAAPDARESFSPDHAGALDLAHEEQMYMVDHSLSAKLQDLAEKLGHLNARPRDAITVHATVLRDRIRDRPGAKVLAYRDGRCPIVFESMGTLASPYRSRTWVGGSEEDGPRRE